jgi:predicted transcriptional regulator
MNCRGATREFPQVRAPRGPADRKADSGWTFSKSTRPPFHDELALYVARRLTDRDRTILSLLADHRVFTTHQLTEAFFDSTTTARHRLTQLHQLRVVQRFSPFVSKGSASYHYVSTA